MDNVRHNRIEKRHRQQKKRKKGHTKGGVDNGC